MNIQELPHTQKAFMFAKISKKAYDDSPSYYSFESRKVAVDNHVAFVLFNQTDIVVVCRGTELDDIRDIKTDAEAILVPSITGTGNGHMGFEKAVSKTWDHIMLIVSSVYTNQNVWFTGHSLGAAMSTIMAALYKKQFPDNNVALFTFGSPKVGDKHNTSLNAVKHHRYVDSADIVPRVPVFPFTHFGTVHYFNTNGKEVKPTFFTVIFDRIHSFFADPANIILKHDIEQYIHVLDQNEDKKL